MRLCHSTAATWPIALALQAHGCAVSHSIFGSSCMSDQCWEPLGARGAEKGPTCAMNICNRHFLKLRISVQTCSSTWRALATCSAGTIRQCPGTRRPLRRHDRASLVSANWHAQASQAEERQVQMWADGRKQQVKKMSHECSGSSGMSAPPANHRLAAAFCSPRQWYVFSSTEQGNPHMAFCIWLYQSVTLAEATIFLRAVMLSRLRQSLDACDGQISYLGGSMR